MFFLTMITLSPSMCFPSKEAPLAYTVTAEGSCAVVGVSPEQCQITALQRARAAAIEEVSGVQVSSSTLVTDLKLTSDFIRTFSRGHIVREEVSWLPLGQYQKDKKTAPIPEYRVKIIADVVTPKPKIATIGLSAKANAGVYRSGEKASINITTSREARIAIFNLTADDNVSLLFPNSGDRENLIQSGKAFVYPDVTTVNELEMQTLPNHKRDAEAFIVVAIDPSYSVGILDRFKPGEPLAVSGFFSKLTEFDDHAEEVLIAYEVVAQ